MKPVFVFRWTRRRTPYYKKVSSDQVEIIVSCVRLSIISSRLNISVHFSGVGVRVYGKYGGVVPALLTGSVRAPQRLGQLTAERQEQINKYPKTRQSTSSLEKRREQNLI